MKDQKALNFYFQNQFSFSKISLINRKKSYYKKLMPCLSMDPKWFWSSTRQSFWTGHIHFVQVQIIKISPEKSNLNLTKMIWTRPTLFGPYQNNLYPNKTIWMVQNNFGPIEGQGIINWWTKLRYRLLLFLKPVIFLKWSRYSRTTKLDGQHSEHTS